MLRLTLLLTLLALLAPSALSQDCSSHPPLRDLPSRAEPFALGSRAYEAGAARTYKFGDVFLSSHTHAIMLWGENECGLWVRAVKFENGANGEGFYQALPKSASGIYEVPGAPGGAPLFTIRPRQLIGGYAVTLMIDVPAAPGTDEGVEAEGVQAEWENRQR